jgi:hypothetical protein
MSDKVFFGNEEASEKFVDKWLTQHENDIAKAGFIGGWHDTEHGEVVLDPVENIQDRDKAVALGAERNQQAIWDVKAGEEIPTGGTGDRPAEG